MIKRQVGQCDCGQPCGLFQMRVQSSVSYSLLCAVQQTQLPCQQTVCVQHSLVSAHATGGVRLQTRCFVSAKPIVSLQGLDLNDYHQYGQLASAHQGLAKTPSPSGGEHTLNYFFQEQPANNLSYGPKALTKKFFHTARGFLNSCLAYLTSLTAHFQGCLLSSAHPYRGFQAKVLPFCSPVGGL